MRMIGYKWQSRESWSKLLQALEGLQLSHSEVQATAVFEANIEPQLHQRGGKAKLHGSSVQGMHACFEALILRFLIDNDLGGGRWIERLSLFWLPSNSF